MDKKTYEVDPVKYWNIEGLEGKQWNFTELPDRKDNPLFDEFIAPEAASFGVCADLGCGAGRYTGYAASLFDRVLAIDFSKHSLNQCKQMMDAVGITNVSYYLENLADMSDIPGESVDFAFTGVVFTHIPNEVKKRALREVSRIMKQDGIVCLVEVFLSNNEAFDCPSISESEWESMIADAGMVIIKQVPVLGLKKYVLRKL